MDAYMPGIGFLFILLCAMLGRYLRQRDGR